MNCYFHATLQLHNLSVDCARELFKPLKDVASLRVCNEKNFFVSKQKNWVLGFLWVML